VQPSELPDVETDPDEGQLGSADAVNIWRGVLITAERTFQPDDDVCKLLRMLAKVPGVLEGSQGSRWPVGRLVTVLNAEFSPPPWSEPRVENAKKRLLNWVQRLMNLLRLPAEEAGQSAFHILGECKLRSRKNAHRRSGILGRGKPSCTDGCGNIFKEKASGARTDRPELAKAIRRLEPGDVLVVTRG
jgi:hypothetical protein